MLLLLLIALPVCVEIAAWVVDSKFETYFLKSPAGADADIETMDRSA